MTARFAPRKGYWPRFAGDDYQGKNEICAVCGHKDTHHPTETTPWPPVLAECESCPGGVCRLPE